MQTSISIAKTNKNFVLYHRLEITIDDAVSMKELVTELEKAFKDVKGMAGEK
jgi:hypothetical protein